MLSAIFSFFLTAAGPSFAELPPSHVEKIANQVITQLAGEYSERPTLTVAMRPEPTPLGVISYANGRCKMVINTNDNAWSEWGRFLKSDNKANWDSIIAISVAHEVGHCLRESKTGQHAVQLSDETLNALGAVGNKSMAMSTRVLKQELFADTVAVIYAKEFMSAATAEIAIGSMLTAREEFGHADPSHDTYRELSAVLSKPLDRLSGETMGAVAVRLLSGHQTVGQVATAPVLTAR